MKASAASSPSSVCARCPRSRSAWSTLECFALHHSWIDAALTGSIQWALVLVAGLDAGCRCNPVWSHGREFSDDECEELTDGDAPRTAPEDGTGNCVLVSR